MIHDFEEAMKSLSGRCDGAAVSSHWRRCHETFRYSDGRFSGLRGFGGDTGRGSLASRLAHYALQWPYRRMGASLPAFPESSRLAALAAHRQGRKLDLDVLRQALTLALLLERLPSEALGGPWIVIGDGFGTLCSLLLLRLPQAKVVSVNLAKTLMVDIAYALRAVPDAGLSLVESAADYRAALSGPQRLVAVNADDFEALRGCPAAAAASIVSMQEMDPPIVARYFELLRSSPVRPWFYCCNREEKTLPDGTRVSFAAYPWKAADQVVLDELCPWQQRWYRPVPPFYFSYDGPIRHRLARLAP